VYKINILEEAIKELNRLDRSVAVRILKKLNWLAENLNDINSERLSADLAEFYKLRVGSYRIIYEIFQDEKLIIIHAIGHRKEIYKR